MAETTPSCFVISSIGEPESEQRKYADRVLKIIQRAIHPMVAMRSDQIAAPGIITNQVIHHILDAELVIADLSGADPDVYYELAIRHATQKPCIQIIRKGEKIPRNLQALRTVVFDPADQYETQKDIAASMKDIGPGESPISDALMPRLYEKLFSEMASDRENSIKRFFDDARTQLNDSLAELKQLTRGIEDATRKPVHGIEQVLVEAHDLLVQKAKVGGQVWFVGMTLGFGAPHIHRRVRRRLAAAALAPGEPVLPDDAEGIGIDEIFNDRWPHRPELKIETLIGAVHQQMKTLLTAAPRATVVCLPHDSETLRARFLQKLAQRQNYRRLKGNDALIQEVVERVQHLHCEVASCVKGGVGYLDSIPLQMMIVEQKEEYGHDRKACLVFHVGTDNIATRQQENGETGVYSEVDNIVEVFQTMAESLRDAAHSRDAEAAR